MDFYESVINELIFLIRSDSFIILVCLINVQNDFISWMFRNEGED